MSRLPLTPPPTFSLFTDPAETLLAALRKHFHTLPRIVEVTTFEEATAAAREAALSGAEVVVAAGGDGTVRAVAEGIAGFDARLGIVPVGTVNVLARELGIPLGDMEVALTVCLGGEERRLDLGEVTTATDTRRFLLMASVGFDALAVANVNTDLKGVVGPPAYLLSGLAALANYAPVALALRFDDDASVWQGAAFMVVVSNTASYGGDFKIAPDALPDDGFLDIAVLAAPSAPVALQRAAFIRQAGAFALGLHRSDPDIHFFRARQVEIRSDPAIPAQLDGDAWGTTPLSIAVVPGALRVCAPAAAAV